MNTFASGPKGSYYGKGDVIAYRLNRDGRVPKGHSPVFGASVLMLVYGDAFWPTYTSGDNTALIATDSMKNFIQRETMNFEGQDLEAYCRFLAAKFVDTYPQVEGIQVSADEVPYESIDGDRQVAFSPSGPERARAQIEIGRAGIIDVRSGIRGFRLLRLGGVRSRDSCATSTPRCRICRIVRCTCGWISNGNISRQRRRSRAGP